MFSLVSCSSFWFKIEHQIRPISLICQKVIHARKWDQIHRFQVAQRREWIWSFFRHSMRFEEHNSAHWKLSQAITHLYLFGRPVMSFWAQALLPKTAASFLQNSDTLNFDIVSKGHSSKILHGEGSLNLDVINSSVCAPEIGFERIRTSDTTKIKVWCILRRIECFEGQNWIQLEKIHQFEIKI